MDRVRGYNPGFVIPIEHIIRLSYCATIKSIKVVSQVGIRRESQPLISRVIA